MSKTDPLSDLKSRISLLEERRANELSLLKLQLTDVMESIRPVNMIKDTIRNLTEDIGFQDEILADTLSISSGYLARKMVVGETDNPVKQLLGNLLQMRVTKYVSEKSDGIKAMFSSLFSKNQKSPE